MKRILFVVAMITLIASMAFAYYCFDTYTCVICGERHQRYVAKSDFKGFYDDMAAPLPTPMKLHFVMFDDLYVCDKCYEKYQEEFNTRIQQAVADFMQEKQAENAEIRRRNILQNKLQDVKELERQILEIQQKKDQILVDINEPNK